MITHAQVLELFRYEAETGLLIWRVGKKVGQIAGRLQPARKFSTRSGMSLPYWQISVLGKTYFRAKLVWFYVTGEWPNEIDHRDTDSLNDRWGNLREATRQQNNANRRVFRNNQTGCKGVHIRPCAKDRIKYRAMISIDGKNRSLGDFADIESARSAYETAASEAFGEFFRAA